MAAQLVAAEKRLFNETSILDGKDLKELGVPPGPSYTLVFRLLSEAKAKGELGPTKEEQMQFVKGLIDSGAI